MSFVRGWYVIGCLVVCLSNYTLRGACCLENGNSYHVPPQSGIPISATFSPDGSLLAVSSDFSFKAGPGGIVLFRAGEQGVLDKGISYTLSSSEPRFTQPSFSPNGTLLATTNFGSAQEVLLCTVASGQLSEATSYSSGSANPWLAVFSPLGTFLVVVNSTISGFGNDSITLFPVEDGVLQQGIAYSVVGSTPFSVAFSPDGLYFVTVNYGSKDVTVFTVGDVNSGRSYTLPLGAEPTVAASLRMDHCLLYLVLTLIMLLYLALQMVFSVKLLRIGYLVVISFLPQ